MTDSRPTDLVDRARSLAPLIEAHANQTETEGTMPAPVVAAIAESGLFGTLVPRELGGLESDISATLAVFEELARADGSTGWSTMANITTAGLASIYVGDEAVKTIFADPDAVLAGMLGPVGTGTAVDGGFRVSGHF
jgi:indole-3-acetate monooxygenase